MIVKEKKNEILFTNKYCFGKITLLDDLIEISLMKVELKWRNKGYGTKFMEYILSHIKTNFPSIKKVILSPLPLDRNGLVLKDLIAFYKKCGFKNSDDCSKDKPYMMEMVI